MLLVRAEFSCAGFPDGSIPHGHIDIKVKQDPEEASFVETWREVQKADDAIRPQLSRDIHPSDGFCSVDLFLLEEKKDADFDKGAAVYAEVVSGEGDALVFNPIGKQFDRSWLG